MGQVMERRAQRLKFENTTHANALNRTKKVYIRWVDCRSIATHLSVNSKPTRCDNLPAPYFNANEETDQSDSYLPCEHVVVPAVLEQGDQ